MEVIEQKMESLGFSCYYKIPLVKKVAEKTKQKPFIIVFAILIVLLVTLFTPIGSSVTTFLAFTIPAFRTFQAIESHTKEDDVRYLTFWIVFGFLYSFDQALSFFLGFIPFYYLLRTVFIALIFIPKYKGAETIYNKGIYPLLKKYEEKIDSIIDPIEEQTRNISLKVKKSE